MSASTITFFLLHARNVLRGEQINIGVAALTPWGVRVVYDVDRARLRAIDPDRATRHDNLADAQALVELLEKLQSTALREMYLQPLGTRGSILAASEEEFERTLNDLLVRDVRPLKVTTRKHREPPQSTRLERQLRVWFRAAKVFSPNADDITRGRVVQHFPISLDEQLFADFALQNGALHVIETLDLRKTERLSKSQRNEAGFKAMLLDQVRDMDPASDRIAVFASDDYAMIRPALSMVAKYASDVIRFDDVQDRQRLADTLGRRLHKQSLPLPTAEQLAPSRVRGKPFLERHIDASLAAGVNRAELPDDLPR